MYKGIDHIAIAVADIEAAAEFYRRVFQLDLVMDLSFPSDGVHTNLVLSLGDHHELELMGPIGRSGFLSKFLDKHGEGVHHLALEVDEIDAATQRLADNGIHIFGSMQEKGMRFTFLHPKSTLHMGMQLMQRKPRKPSHNPLIKGIDHVAVQVATPEEGRRFFAAMGARPAGVFDDDRLHCKGEIFSAGRSRFHLLHDFSAASPAPHPAGLHHIALRVENISEACRHLAQCGVQPLKTGSDTDSVFLPPARMHGCLWQLTTTDTGPSR